MDNSRKLRNYKPTVFKANDSVYKERFADSAVFFINNLKHPSGKWYGKNFELMDWQEQIIRDVFGVVRKSDECRQFGTVYIEVPKKNGKSELAAAVALLLTCADNERGGAIYGCATDISQARLVFDVAVSMIDNFPDLKKFVRYDKAQKRIIFKPLNSFYQVVSAESYNKDGLNAHGVIFDELHAQLDRRFFDVMMTGSGYAREQPLKFIITTAGVDRNSIGWEIHQRAEDILRGKRIEPSFYPVIYKAEEGDDWTSPEVWKKANPSLGVTFGIDKIKVDCENAKQNVAEENLFRRLNLNQWVKQTSRWLPMEKWDTCDFEVDEQKLLGRECYGGLDLSSTRDITAFVLVFPPENEDEKFVILPNFWIPEEGLAERVRRDHVPYDIWQQKGLINITDGEVIDYNFVQKKIEELGEKYNIKEIAFDRWGAMQMAINLDNAGFTVAKFGQGFKDMSPASKELMRLVLERKIAHGGNLPLRWMMDNIVVKTDEAGNIKPDKKKATEKIDGAVALIMALDRAIRHQNTSVYDKRGVLIIDLDDPRGYYYSNEKAGEKSS
jgi:phage terminase large subunit-like protein